MNQQNTFRTCFYCGFTGEKVSEILDRGRLINVCDNLEECDKRMVKNIVEKNLEILKNETKSP
ncbi:MAG: hypothetical protein WC389_16830 [Lutibacter sp.]|jgi:hypothetical protein